MRVERAENSSSVRGRGSWTSSASRYTSTRRMLCTLTSGALRRGAGQLSMTRFPRCTPERSSVRCGTASTGGSGGGRFSQPGKGKAKSRKEKGKKKKKKRRGLQNPCLLEKKRALSKHFSFSPLLFP